jgi:hypothetical protein
MPETEGIRKYIYKKLMVNSSLFEENNLNPNEMAKLFDKCCFDLTSEVMGNNEKISRFISKEQQQALIKDAFDYFLSCLFIIKVCDRIGVDQEKYLSFINNHVFNIMNFIDHGLEIAQQSLVINEYKVSEQAIERGKTLRDLMKTDKKSALFILSHIIESKIRDIKSVFPAFARNSEIDEDKLVIINAYLAMLTLFKGNKIMENLIKELYEQHYRLNLDDVNYEEVVDQENIKMFNTLLSAALEEHAIVPYADKNKFLVFQKKFSLYNTCVYLVNQDETLDNVVIGHRFKEINCFNGHSFLVNTEKAVKIIAEMSVYRDFMSSFIENQELVDFNTIINLIIMQGKEEVSSIFGLNDLDCNSDEKNDNSYQIIMAKRLHDFIENNDITTAKVFLKLRRKMMEYKINMSEVSKEKRAALIIGILKEISNEHYENNYGLSFDDIIKPFITYSLFLSINSKEKSSD